MASLILIKNNHETKPNTSEFYRLFLNLSNEGKLKYLKDIELENLKVEIENNYFTKSALKTESNIKLQRDAEGISGKILLLVCSQYLSSWTGLGKSGHVQSQSFR